MIDLGFAWRYLLYKLKSSHRAGHGIHSPFVFDLVCNVLEDTRHFYAYWDIAKIRRKMLTINEKIECKPIGATSKNGITHTKTVSHIASTQSVSPKFGELLFRLINYYKPATILELGTSLGISTLYLSMPTPKATIVSIEGCKNKIRIAKQNFKELGCNNITLIDGEFDTYLPVALQRLQKTDFVFIDGNHTYNATLAYFEQCLKYSNPNTIFVLDDIHWSKEMEQAWVKICNHSETTLSIDLFYMGIVFLNEELSKQTFIIAF